MKRLWADLKLYYTVFILNTKPIIAWRATRLILHWLSLPFKVTYNVSVGLFQIIRHQVMLKVRDIPELPSPEIKKEYITEVMKRLPLWKDKNNGFIVHVNGVSLLEQPMGWNHQTNNQLARHGIYTFLMGKLDKRTHNMDAGLYKHVQRGRLARGYKLNPYEGEIVHDYTSISRNEVLSFSLAMLNMRKEDLLSPDLTIGFLKERYDEILSSILDQDYSVIESGLPKDKLNADIWKKLEAMNERLIHKKYMKSNYADFSPGATLSGLDAITLLAAVRVGDRVIGAAYAKKEYSKLIFRMGYGLLSLVPTAFLNQSRDYVKEHNAITAAYILSKLASNVWGRWFWKIPMMYIWLLSRKWHNSYFTGLVEDAHEGTMSASYIKACEAFLYEEKPNTFSYSDSSNLPTTLVPVKFNEMNQGEFFSEQESRLLLPKELSDEDKYQVMRGLDRYRSGLGWFAGAVMIDKNLKETLNDATKAAVG